jgi:BTB/POZ domain
MSLDLGSFRVSNVSGGTRNQALSWRMDATESLSDWTLEINGTDVYHVHKSFLAAGKRSSLYFERLFQSKMSETSLSLSRIDLESSAAHAVPAMLDFMYYHNAEIKATTYTAVALRYLANYFEMEELFESVNRFIQHDFGPSTALSYLVEASLYNDAKISDAAGITCGQHFGELTEEQLRRLTPTTLHKIVTTPDFVGDSLKLSRIVARFCVDYPDMDDKLLEQMTTFVRMPTVDPEIALSLLNSAMTRGQATLRNRTVKAASEQWQELAICLETKFNNDFYLQLQDDVKVKVLEKSLLQARSDVLMLDEEKKDLKKELREKSRDLKRRQKLIAEAVEGTREELSREFELSFTEYAERMHAEKRKALEEKEAIIVTLRAQLMAYKEKSGRRLVSAIPDGS